MNQVLQTPEKSRPSGHALAWGLPLGTALLVPVCTPCSGCLGHLKGHTAEFCQGFDWKGEEVGGWRCEDEFLLRAGIGER